MDKVRIGAVSYLNTVPMIYGLQFPPIVSRIELITAFPRKVAIALENKELDLGLVPVAILPQLSNYKIVSDYCIGAVDNVETVCLFSEVPIEEVQTIYLDYQSRTSIALAQILLKHYWKLKPEFIPATPGFEKRIAGTTAGVVIGDRTFSLRKIKPYKYDLATAWNQWTGLPFIFAAWTAISPLTDAFIDDFNAAIKLGLDQLDTVIASMPPIDYDLKKYYTQNISFERTPEKMEGLKLFHAYLRETELAKLDI